MRTELVQARENLRQKLIKNAYDVIREILAADLNDIIEIGIFGSLAKDSFTCNSDSDIYLLFDKHLPGRIIKGHLRSIAEEHNCDIVFIKSEDLTGDDVNLLAKNILENRITLWRRADDKE